MRFTPNSRLAIWQATRLVSSVLVTATKASQLATSAVRRVSKLKESPQMTGISSVSARVRHSASCGSMMVTLWWWDSRLWARYIPTRPPPAIQTFISLPHSTVCKAKTGCFHGNQFCSMSRDKSLHPLGGRWRVAPDEGQHQLPRRGSQGLKPIAKVLGIMRRLSAVLLALPLRKDFHPLRGKMSRSAFKIIPHKKAAAQNPVQQP